VNYVDFKMHGATIKKGYVSSKLLKPLTERNSITSQKTGIWFYQ